MSPMFNTCMNTGGGGPPHLGPPQPNGPMPNQNGPNDSGFYTPAPHFNNNAHHNNFNNNVRNISTRQFMYSPQFKIYELNKRLTDRPDECDNIWWNTFATEFFDDNSTLTLTFTLDDGPKRYTIGRVLIPRYFRTLFEGGVTDLSFRLKRAKESVVRNIITLECDNCTLVTHHGKANYNKQMLHYPTGMDPMLMKENKDTSLIVTTEGKLVLEFTNDDSMRIRTWNFSTTHYQEFILRSLVAMQAQQDPGLLDQLSKNVTRQGLTSHTLNYLKLCVLLEPMQLLMARQKEFDGASPRDCLKCVLHAKWRNVCESHEQQRPQNKRRKRKSSTPNNAGGGGGKKKNNSQMSPGTPNFPLANQEVMVVGEPTQMGGEFGEEDERVITRLENAQYDSSVVSTNGLDENDDFSATLAGPPQQSQQQQSQNSNPQQGPSQQVQPNPNQGQLNPGSQNQVPPGQSQWQPNMQQHNQVHNLNVPINNNNNNGLSGPIQGNGVSNNATSLEDKKPSPISQ